MNRIHLILIACAFAIANPASAFEATALGGLGFSDLAGDPVLDFTPKPALVWGAQIGFDITPNLSFETGGILSIRRLEQSNASVTVEQKIPTLIFPLLLRVSPSPVISMGIGAYLGLYRQAVHETTRTRIGDVSSEIDRDPETAGLDDPELGVMASIRLNGSFTSGIGPVLDLRYLVALSSWKITPQENLRFREFQILTGIRFKI